MLMQILSPLYLPVLHLVTLVTAPATAAYAGLGLLTAPITVPILIALKAIKFALFSPLLLLALPVAIPVGGFLAFLCQLFDVLHALFVTFTPLLWPVYFLCKWWKLTCLVAQVIVMDTVAPWLVPIRFAFLAAILPKLLFK